MQDISSTLFVLRVLLVCGEILYKAVPKGMSNNLYGGALT